MARITNARGKGGEAGRRGEGAAPRPPYGIGALSRLTGVHVETIRYYERIGLVAPPPRTAGGNRQYDEAARRRLAFIRRCRDLGFSLEEIRALLGMVDQPGASCGEVQAMTRAHLEAVRGRIRSLRLLEATLEEMEKSCGAGDLPECPIIETLFEEGESTASP